jgi:hypothetical protein
MYLIAPSEVAIITGVFVFCDVSKTAFVHSKLLMLKCPTAYLPL